MVDVLRFTRGEADETLNNTVDNGTNRTRGRTLVAVALPNLYTNLFIRVIDTVT